MVIEAALSVGNPEAPKIIPFGSLDADQGTASLTPEDENHKPFHAIICTGI
ncbi:hypothetical protein ABT404_01200 [Streptomyces hyaluromycini]|uniref:Uncharacterized protein n=1 Tax=Streptomyces hyaluromycini TaxID=1377993 RepID=A0ABV1WMS1_9ACTN